jgi:hypothetical protein
VSGPERPAGSRDALPPLVLRCRILPRSLHLAAALYFLASGTLFLARGMERLTPSNFMIWRGGLGLLVGGCAAYYTARYCFASLILDDRGFRLSSPLGDTDVSWSEVVDWRRRPPKGGLVPSIQVLHGLDRRRLFVPLIFEESHALEVGLQQRGFPRY